MEKTLAPHKTSSPAITECSQSSFSFARHFRRQVSARFDGGVISSDGGALLLREVDRRINLLPRLAACFEDRRDPRRIEHQVGELVSQRVYALALGYEDLNDHDELRSDPLLALLAGKSDLAGQQRKQERDRGKPLAGKSTLQRLEGTTDGVDRYQKIRCDNEAIDRLLVEVFVEAQPQEPAEIILDIDATDTPLHGQQEGRFFHGYYGHYCYLPLYIFSGQHVLCARQRVSNQDAAEGSVAELNRIVAQIRDVWPEVKIILRADAGFCRDELLSWCEANGVDYVVGLARNERLRSLIEETMQQAAQRQQQTGRPARVFTEFAYQTRQSWSRARRVVAKAEQLPGKQNPRYVVTSPGRRSLAGASVVRTTLLRARGGRESHQGAVESVRRSDEQRDAAGQSVAAVSVVAGVRVAGGAATAGAEGHALGAGTDGDDTAGVVEDRRAGEGERAAGVPVAGRRLPR